MKSYRSLDLINLKYRKKTSVMFTTAHVVRYHDREQLNLLVSFEGRKNGHIQNVGALYELLFLIMKITLN